MRAQILSPNGMLIATFPALERGLNGAGSHPEYRFTKAWVEMMLAKTGFCNFDVKTVVWKILVPSFMNAAGRSDISLAPIQTVREKNSRRDFVLTRSLCAM